MELADSPQPGAREGDVVEEALRLRLVREGQRAGIHAERLMRRHDNELSQRRVQTRAYDRDHRSPDSWFAVRSS
jgi:ribosomal protein S21